MALAFKRSRNDTAVDRSFPNAKETVIFRDDVSNRNLLKNPWRTATEAVGQAGVLNRPSRITTDNRGNVFAQSFNLLREGVSNKNLLMNPYNFMVDPDDEKRTLSRQVIMDINNGTAPKYVRENKGIDEIAFTILQLLPDNGVKLATISMLKSYITGRRLLAVLDQGGQKITRSFDVFNQLISSSKNLYKNGELGLKVPSLLLKYSESMKEIFGDAVLQDVMPQTIYAAIQDLSTVSTVLSKLFRSENMISASTNLSVDEWTAIENSRLQKLKEIEQARQAQIIKIGEPPMPVRESGESAEVWAAKLNKYYNELSEYTTQGTTSTEPTAAVLPGSRRSGDNYPTGTQGVLDPNNIKQEGGKRKKKKILKVVGGYRSSTQQTVLSKPSTGSSGSTGDTNTNTNKRPNTQPPIQIDISNGSDTSNKVNTQPPVQVEITNQPESSKWAKAGAILSGGIPIALGLYNAYSKYSDRQAVIERDARDAEREEREKNRDNRERARFREEGTRLQEEMVRRRQDKQLDIAKDQRDADRFEMEKKLYEEKMKSQIEKTKLSQLLTELTAREEAEYNRLTRLDRGNRISTREVNEYFRKIVITPGGAENPTQKRIKIIEALQNQGLDLPGEAADEPFYFASGRKRTKKRGRGGKIKRSTNLDAQILALLKS